MSASSNNVNTERPAREAAKAINEYWLTRGYGVCAEAVKMPPPKNGGSSVWGVRSTLVNGKPGPASIRLNPENHA